MSARVGTVGSLVIASAILGVSTGRVIAPAITDPAMLANGMLLTFVATGTVGNRNIFLEARDAAGNAFLRIGNGVNITAGQTIVHLYGGWVLNTQIGTTHLLPLPVGFTLPTFGTLRFFDAANVDVNDSVSGVISWNA